ncbi:MAG: hypothetical protein J2P18_16620 [Nocardia sp.]|nr:hypothetical protein [Nocardia sp.]
MADKVEVEVDKLRNAAGKTGDVRDRISQIVGDLHTKVNSYGDCWGDDDLGNQFAGTGNGQGYKAARDNMFSGAGNFTKAFGQFSDGQDQSASQLEMYEHGNADGFRK